MGINFINKLKSLGRGQPSASKKEISFTQELTKEAGPSKLSLAVKELKGLKFDKASLEKGEQLVKRAVATGFQKAKARLRRSRNAETQSQTEYYLTKAEQDRKLVEKQLYQEAVRVYRNMDLRKLFLPATLKIRLFAGLIDFFLLALGLGVLILIGVAGITPSTILVIILSPLIMGLSIAKWGSTPGQHFFKIIVVDKHGKYLDADSAIKRCIYALIGYIPMAVGFLRAFFVENKETFHDMRAETSVIFENLLSERHLFAIVKEYEQGKKSNYGFSSSRDYTAEPESATIIQMPRAVAPLDASQNSDIPTDPFGTPAVEDIDATLFVTKDAASADQLFGGDNPTLALGNEIGPSGMLPPNLDKSLSVGDFRLSGQITDSPGGSIALSQREKHEMLGMSRPVGVKRYKDHRWGAVFSAVVSHAIVYSFLGSVYLFPLLSGELSWVETQTAIFNDQASVAAFIDATQLNVSRSADVIYDDVNYTVEKMMDDIPARIEASSKFGRDLLNAVSGQLDIDNGGSQKPLATFNVPHRKRLAAKTMLPKRKLRRHLLKKSLIQPVVARELSSYQKGVKMIKARNFEEANAFIVQNFPLWSDKNCEIRNQYSELFYQFGAFSLTKSNLTKVIKRKACGKHRHIAQIRWRERFLFNVYE